jgi:predicted protein tyrosine phosphatase
MYVEVGNKAQIIGHIGGHVAPNNPQLNAYTHIYSIQDKHDKDLKIRKDVVYGTHKIIHFDDAQENCLMGDPPTVTDIREIIHFARTLDDDSKLYIHCFAGISRSTAAACGILVTRSLDKYGQIQTGFEEWKAIRNCKLFWPNAWMIKLFDQELRLEGKLIALMDAWRADISQYGTFMVE